MQMCVSLLVSDLSHCAASEDRHTHGKTGFHPAAAHLSCLVSNHCPAATHTHHGPDFHTCCNFLETCPFGKLLFIPQDTAQTSWSSPDFLSHPFYIRTHPSFKCISVDLWPSFLTTWKFILICGFTFWGFSYPRSTTVWKY